LAKAALQQVDKTRNRRLRFSGAKNFRDLGGFKTVDGRTVRWACLYRSDALNKLTYADLKLLSALHLHQIIDLRSDYERQLYPDRLPTELTSLVVEIPILDRGSEMFKGPRDELAKILEKIDVTEFMSSAYVEYASRFTSEMRQFLDVLISSNGLPVLFHCTAGKDRTGFAAALVLRILGIPQNIVLDDYLLSNQHFYSGHRWNRALLRILRGKQFANVINDFMMVRATDLSTAFETIDRDFGSFENYVSNELRLSSHDVEQLKSLYLE
jgi:protein-tyrosine phosphatase